MMTLTCPKRAKCSKCGTPVEPKSEDLADILNVLEVVSTRAEAPNARVCRAVLKETYGVKRGRQLIDLLLEDHVIPGTIAYNKRHIMLLNKQPLRPKTSSDLNISSSP